MSFADERTLRKYVDQLLKQPNKPRRTGSGIAWRGSADDLAVDTPHDFPGAPQIADLLQMSSSFGLPGERIRRLQDAAVSGTGGA